MKKKVFYLIAIYLLTFCSISFSQEVYVDIDPDHYMYSNDDNYLLDMNADGIDDFEIHFEFDIYFYDADIWIEGLNDAEIYYEPSEEYSGVVDILDTIHENLDWGTISHLAKLPEWGNWWDVENKCLGVRIPDNGGFLYGWIRLDGPGTYYGGDKIVIKDYGYKTVLDQYIIAGLPVYLKVDNVEVSDIGNNRDGTDLQVSFVKVLGDNEIIEYRMMAVKAENAGSFSLEQALLLSSEKYLSIQPTNQGLYEQTFEETSMDVDGDLIINLQAYNVFVLTYINLPDYEGLLSNASLEIMLKTPAETVVNIVAEDVADYGDGRDIKVVFDKIGDETTISEYRLFVVDFSDADSFDRYAAENLSEEFYTVVSPSGQNIEISLTETSQTVDGLSINSGGYNIFVLSVADGIQTDYSGFSGSEIITGLVRPNDNMILAGQVREEAIFVDEYISVAGEFPQGGESQNIDFNNDGIDDAVISAYSWSSMAGSGGDASISSLNNTKLVELPLDLNTPIGKDLVWGSSSGYTSCSSIMNSTNCVGEWNGVGTKYLGVLIKKSNNDTVFCWAKLNSNSNGGGSISIQEWAYVDLDGLFVRENPMKEIRIFPNPAKDYIQIELTSFECKEVSLEILDNAGRIMDSKNIGLKNGTLSEKLDVSKLDTGIYFLRILSEKREFKTRKIVVW